MIILFHQEFFARNPSHLLHWLDCVFSLANSHLMLHPNNSVAAVAAHCQGCSYLFPTDEAEWGYKGPTDDGQFEGFRQVKKS